MNLFFTYFFVGLGVGLVLFPIGLAIYIFVSSYLLKKKIIKMIKRGEFLQPLDALDYDSEKWKDMIDVEANAKLLENLNERIFKKEVMKDA